MRTTGIRSFLEEDDGRDEAQREMVRVELFDSFLRTAAQRKQLKSALADVEKPLLAQVPRSIVNIIADGTDGMEPSATYLPTVVFMIADISGFTRTSENLCKQVVTR